MPLPRCPVCGIITKEKMHCIPKPRLQSRCPDCGEPSRDPNHCANKRRCDVPGCNSIASYRCTTPEAGDPDRDAVTCKACASVSVWKTVVAQWWWDEYGKPMGRNPTLKDYRSMLDANS